MDKKINLEKILLDSWTENRARLDLTPIDLKYNEWAKISMIEFGRQLLELSSENADVVELYKGKTYDIQSSFWPTEDSQYKVNKQSITDTLKQIEL